MPEPKPFSSKWYSHKFRGPGIQYDLGICIKTGWIVSYNGLFECGAWPDLWMFKSKLKTKLLYCKMVVADHGYCGEPCIFHPDWVTKKQKKAMGKAQAYHKTINVRINFWNILKHIFVNHAISIILPLGRSWWWNSWRSSMAKPLFRWSQLMIPLLIGNSVMSS